MPDPKNKFDGTGMKAPPLDYAPPGITISRRRYRTLLWLTTLSTSLLVCFVLGPLTWKVGHGSYQQWQAQRAKVAAEQARVAAEKRREAQRIAALPKAMKYASPGDQVVYEEDPQAAAVLM